MVLGHGSGGKLSAELIRDIFLPAFQNPVLASLDDQADVNVNGAASGIHHRFFRGEAVVFSWRRHWFAGSARHNQRFGDGRRHAAVLERGFIH